MQRRVPKCSCMNTRMCKCYVNVQRYVPCLKNTQMYELHNRFLTCGKTHQTRPRSTIVKPSWFETMKKVRRRINWNPDVRKRLPCTSSSGAPRTHQSKQAPRASATYFFLHTKGERLKMTSRPCCEPFLFTVVHDCGAQHNWKSLFASIINEVKLRTQLLKHCQRNEDVHPHQTVAPSTRPAT